MLIKLVLIVVAMILAINWIRDYWDSRMDMNKFMIIKEHLPDIPLKILNHSGDRISEYLRKLDHEIYDESSDVYPNNTFDIIIGGNSTNKAISDMKRVLVPKKGKLILIEDVIDGDKDVLLGELNILANYGGEKLHFYSDKKWRKKFNQLGLTISVSEKIDPYRYNILYPISKRIYVLQK